MLCDGASPSAVRAEFSGGCRLFGTTNSGALEFSRGGRLAFDEFVLGSVRQVDGELAVEAEAGEVRRITVDTGDALTISSNAGKSCEKRLTLRSLTAEDTGEETRLEVDAERLSDGKTIAVKTLGAPLVWQQSSSCSCPTSGSVELRSHDLLGLGEQSRLRLHYSQGDTEHCSQVRAEIVNWPDECEDAADCGRDVLESLVGSLVTATCKSRG